MHSTSYESVYEILWDAADREKAGTSLNNSMLFAVGAAIEQLIDREGDKLIRISESKIKQQLRPPATREAVPTRTPPTASDDDVFMRKFFGLPVAESRGAGMFCCSEAEVEAQVDMLNVIASQKEAPETMSRDDVFQAGMKVLTETLKGRPDCEKDAIVARLRQVIHKNNEPTPDLKAGGET